MASNIPSKTDAVIPTKTNTGGGTTQVPSNIPSNVNPVLDGATFKSFYMRKRLTFQDTEYTADYITFNAEESAKKGITWKPIAPGYFRMFPNSEDQPCPSGFFCPDNTTQPLYCPARFVCSNDTKDIKVCKIGQFCPMGTVNAYNCSFFASCPQGTDKPTRFGIFGFVIALAVIMAYCFYIKKLFDAKRKSLRDLSMKRLLVMGDAGSVAVVSKDDEHSNRPFDIEFTNLTRRLSNGVYIMQGVTGQLNSSRLCAIMGVSGAGKSTFISLLMNPKLRTKGEVCIGGRKEELSKYAKLVGFVPQEDIMLRELTVDDILTHSARMRLPAGTSKDDVTNKVNSVVSFLQLSHVSGSAIGDEARRGISGGQRKRVNIGMELVAEPKVLFLDEPTSGLDSSTSLEVCTMLRDIAEKQHLTIAAVIHSPSPATFAQFHDLMLLGKGGRLVYLGPRDKAPAYFEEVGFRVPDGMSESDFYMDVMSGRIPSSFEPNFEPSMLFDYWEAHCAGDAIVERLPGAAGQSGKDGHDHGGEKSNALATAKKWVLALPLFLWSLILGIFWMLKEFGLFLVSLVACQSDPVRDTPNGFVVLSLCIKRAILQVYRSLLSFLGDQILHLGCGAFISIASQQMEFLGAQPAGVCDYAPIAVGWMCSQPIDHIREVGIFMSLGVLFAGISVGTQTFGNELVVFWRDSASGMPTLPYFLGKLVSDIPRIIVAAIMFSLSMVLFWPYRSNFSAIFVIILLLYFVAFAMGYFLSTIFSRQSVGLIGTGFALAWALVFSGVTPQLDDVMNPNGIYSGFNFMWTISAPRYAIEALYLREVAARSFVDKNTPRFGYSTDMLTKDFAYIFVIGLAWLALSFIGLKLSLRGRN
ncbi:hypothetical protein AMAG_01237 [Allomyces macrogynus ATCC 38327]|uniref:ABC transporter domain-containing protein n=1 Tax=Allomyces macrogynus (strain ATCC 38327) TaxID=578462 RepID=A0A0L0RYV3_ALLM3|nr:hypothetical protein AMAG_01237 [Allomyces macrogynus ATCC 38327]|eukprot:KNE55335.1 hypothetical protein AMAG_01237 [Allomyces macrogynus ATCC 38327]